MEMAKRFFMDVSNDSNFARQINEAKSREAFLKVAEEKGYSLSEGDIQQIKKIASVISKQEAGEELTEEELLIVSGGGPIKRRPFTKIPGVRNSINAEVANLIHTAEYL